MIELKQKFNRMCDATRDFRHAVENYLKENGEQTIEGDYEDEPFRLTTIDDNGTGTIVFGIDKIRYNEERDCVEFHAVDENYVPVDYWYMATILGSDDTYLFRQIIFPL